jgi:hypothetical protein
MIIERPNPFNPRMKRTMDIPNLTQSQYDNWNLGGALVQVAMPHLTADEREFIIAGYIGNEFFTGEEDKHDSSVPNKE